MEGTFLSAIQRIGGKPVGGFTTAVGDVNRLLALVAYDDFAAYGKANQAAQEGPRPPEVGASRRRHDEPGERLYPPADPRLGAKVDRPVPRLAAEPLPQARRSPGR